jgi:hypothetical protein
LKEDDKIAEYFIHKMVVVQFEKKPLMMTFFEDQKVKVYDGETFKQMQEVRFASDYGIAKTQSKERERSAESKTGNPAPQSVHGNLSRQISGASSFEHGFGRAPNISVGMETMLEAIEEHGSLRRANSRKKVEIASNMLLEENGGKVLFQKRLGLNQVPALHKRPNSNIDLRLAKSKHDSKNLDKSFHSQSGSISSHRPNDTHISGSGTSEAQSVSKLRGRA